MKTNLTDTFIGRIQAPAAGQAEYWDEKVSGLYLRVSQGGVMAWNLKYRLGKRTRRMRLGTTKDHNVDSARKLARNLKAQVLTGADPAVESKAAREEATLSELWGEYLEKHARPHQRERSIKDAEWYVAKYIPAVWHNRRLSEFGRGDMERLHSTIGREHGHYSANHTIRLLRCMFNLARDWGMVTGDNPAARIRLYKETKRKRYLTPDELRRVNQALLAESDWRWQAYFPLSLLLGTRRNELLAARWEHVDLQARTICFPLTKSGEAHLLPLSEHAMSIIADLPSQHMEGGWLFPGDGRTGHVVEPSIAWRRIRGRAGVPDVRIHDLRHTLASWMVGQGFGLPLIGRALNHSQVSTTARYAHLALDPVRLAMEQTAQLMFPTTPALPKPEEAEHEEA